MNSVMHMSPVKKMYEKHEKLSALKGLGTKSEALLNKIDVYTRSELEEMGPIRAFNELKEMEGSSVSLNLLYAMVGALENKHWADIAKSERARLLFELEDYQTLLKILGENEIK